jgi:LAO/AO transport system kinase
MEHPENDVAYKGLKVNKGVSAPTVNPYLKSIPKRKRYSVDEYVEGILQGDITILSQAVTLIESAKHEHQALAQEIIENACHTLESRYGLVSPVCRVQAKVLQ